MFIIMKTKLLLLSTALACTSLAATAQTQSTTPKTITSSNAEFFIDNQWYGIDDNGKTVYYQPVFSHEPLNGVAYNPADTFTNSTGDTTFVTNPYSFALKGTSKAGEQTWFSKFNLEEKGWKAEEKWDSLATEASLRLSDTYIGNAVFLGADVLGDDITFMSGVARYDADGYMTDEYLKSGSDGWISTKNPGTNIEFYDQVYIYWQENTENTLVTRIRNLYPTGYTYVGTTYAGIHFRDWYPFRNSQWKDIDNNKTTTYVVYRYVKVLDSNYLNALNSGQSHNERFVKVGNNWYYCPLAQNEGEDHHYVHANGYLGYKFTVNHTGKSESSTGVDDVVSLKDIVATRYINLQGQVSTTPFKGVNIVEHTYSDGAKKTVKAIY